MDYSRPGFHSHTDDTIVLAQPKPLPLVDTNPTEIADFLKKAAKDLGLGPDDIAIAEAAAKQAEADGANAEAALHAAVKVAGALVQAKAAKLSAE
jgi:hypothetical protein